MAWSKLRAMSCTTCRQSFPMICGEMVHPADVVCDDCIVALWEQVGREGAESVEVSVAGRAQMRMGLGPDILAAQVARKVVELRQLFGSRVELDTALKARRTP